MERRIHDFGLNALDAQNLIAGRSVPEYQSSEENWFHPIRSYSAQVRRAPD